MKTIKNIALTSFIAAILLASVLTFKTGRPTLREFRSCLTKNTSNNYTNFISDYIN